MKNISTGTGIALLAGAIVVYPILDRVMPKADASATYAAAVLAAATTQVEPTIVWYSVVPTINSGNYVDRSKDIFRAWSDGRIEMTQGEFYNVSSGCRWETRACDPTGGWVVVSSLAQGLGYRSDINFDSKVDGADLGMLLGDWGDAPRHDITPSDCPLNLINP